jgi:hypothetical protein
LNYLSVLQFRQTCMIDEGIEYQIHRLVVCVLGERSSSQQCFNYPETIQTLSQFACSNSTSLARRKSQISRDLNQRHRVAFVIHQTSIQAKRHESHRQQQHCGICRRQRSDIWDRFDRRVPARRCPI